MLIPVESLVFQKAQISMASDSIHSRFLTHTADQNYRPCSGQKYYLHRIEIPDQS
jgi:hypothetical protein